MAQEKTLMITLTVPQFNGTDLFDLQRIIVRLERDEPLALRREGSNLV